MTMTKQIQNLKFKRRGKTFRPRFEFSVLVIGICLGFVICNLGFPAYGQEIRLRRTPPVPPRAADGNKPQATGAPNVVRGDEITPKQKDAVEKGLIWLSNHQGKEGSYGGDGMGRHAGITGLAGLAFM